jgi:hypothetical protein
MTHNRMPSIRMTFKITAMSRMRTLSRMTNNGITLYRMTLNSMTLMLITLSSN